MFSKTKTNTLLFGSFTSSTINTFFEHIQLISSMACGFSFMAAALTDPVIFKPSKGVTLLNAMYGTKYSRMDQIKKFEGDHTPSKI